ncbi:hypothetical protein B0H17DRAFT_1136445 [Mycena rosella]|uniref:Uncharacterized protein n=1 Tax=Mycena rosella TaxID=1033263 RepID=A0AAD7GGK7_MYCRO|nr:hypothetical protein B0H17DRAFT_1136445 [Mycena rosella]
MEVKEECPGPGPRPPKFKHVIQMLLAKNGHPLPLSGSRRWYSHRPTVSRGRLPTTPAHHKPSDATSRLVLKALASAIDVYPPLSRGHPSSFCAPLKFKLLVEPRVPTLAEFRALADLRFLGPFTDFLREKGAHRPADAAELEALGTGPRGARVADRRRLGARGVFGCVGAAGAAVTIIMFLFWGRCLRSLCLHVLATPPHSSARASSVLIRVLGEKPTSCIRTHARIAVSIPIPTASTARIRNSYAGSGRQYTWEDISVEGVYEAVRVRIKGWRGGMRMGAAAVRNGRTSAKDTIRGGMGASGHHRTVAWLRECRTAAWKTTPIILEARPPKLFKIRLFSR